VRQNGLRPISTEDCNSKLSCFQDSVRYFYQSGEFDSALSFPALWRTGFAWAI
jgi:hypothetical protein